MWARRFLISGRVQGVGFRWFVKDTAVREGVTGWVQNLPDGRVEALVEGQPDAVRRVEQALRIGPRGARVDRVNILPDEPTGAYNAFSIT
jgi:acylphosphatase